MLPQSLHVYMPNSTHQAYQTEFIPPSPGFSPLDSYIFLLHKVFNYLFTCLSLLSTLWPFWLEYLFTLLMPESAQGLVLSWYSVSLVEWMNEWICHLFTSSVHDHLSFLFFFFLLFPTPAYYPERQCITVVTTKAPSGVAPIGLQEQIVKYSGIFFSWC